AIRERRCKRRDGRGRARVVYATREQEVEFVGAIERSEALDGRIPQNEARARSHMTAARTSLEHEAACTGLREVLDQPGRRRVQIGADAIGFERRRLRWSSTGDERDRGADLPDDLELFVAQFGRHETQDSDAPGAVTEEVGGLGEEWPHLFGAQ